MPEETYTCICRENLERASGIFENVVQACQKFQNNAHGSYRFDDLLFKDFSRTFQGLLTTFKESLSTGTISHFFHSHSKKAIPVSANNVALFMCDFNADSPMFEMSIIRWQHLHKAFFLSALDAVNQPL